MDGLFDCFSRQVTTSCYTCVFVSFVFLMPRACFFAVLADRPPLVAICVIYVFFIVFDAMRKVFIGFEDSHHSLLYVF